jgi:hypothetical protein
MRNIDFHSYVLIIYASWMPRLAFDGLDWEVECSPKKTSVILEKKTLYLG